MKDKKKILVAPLNWGLGHATRCIPIIKELLAGEFDVIIASDGSALELLKKEFPFLPFENLPSYNITYSQKSSHFKRKLLLSAPRVLRTIKEENNVLKLLIEKHQISGVISDNRLGLYSSKVPTVFITHQLTVLSGKTTWLTTYLHRHYIKRFTECWIPDYADSNNLSGLLGHPRKKFLPVKYIGPLSRMEVREEPLTHKLLVVLSGPEPQRTNLEKILLDKLKKYNGKILFIQGLVEEDQTKYQNGNIEVINFLTTPELEAAINSSEFVLARSGYTTIMDLENLEKKAFFIPTPGQTEQEYLARRLKEKGISPYSSQNEFKVKDLAKLQVYKGFTSKKEQIDLRQFFGLFECKGKFRTNSKFALNIDFLFMRLNNMLDNRKALNLFVPF